MKLYKKKNVGTQKSSVLNSKKRAYRNRIANTSNKSEEKIKQN